MSNQFNTFADTKVPRAGVTEQESVFPIIVLYETKVGFCTSGIFTFVCLFVCCLQKMVIIHENIGLKEVICVDQVKTKLNNTWLVFDFCTTLFCGIGPSSSCGTFRFIVIKPETNLMYLW